MSGTEKPKMDVLYVAMGNGLNSNLGGSINRSIEIARHLRADGHRVRFLTTSGGKGACDSKGLDAEFELVRCAFGRTKETSAVDRLLAYIVGTWFAVLRALARGGRTFVISDSDYFCDVIPAFLLAKLHGLPWYASIHHRMDRTTYVRWRIRFLASLWAQRFGFRLVRAAQGLIVYDSPEGYRIATEVRRRGRGPKHVIYTGNGIDLEEIARTPPAKVRSEGIFVGGIRPSKGIHDLAGIWSRVLRKVPSARLHVVGTGLPEYEREMRLQIGETPGLPGTIHFLGGLPHQDTIAVMKSSRVLVLPSYEEGWGTVLCEALGCGIQVVAYDLPSFPAIIREHIVRIPVGDVARFADAVVEALARDMDDLKSLSRMSPQLLEELSWNTIARKEIVALQGGSSS